MGNQVAYTTVSPFFPVRGSGSLPSTTEYGYSAPACCAHPGLHPKEGEGKVHSPVQSSTLLTDYHISRHVASTFKCLTNIPHTATLASFHYRDGVSQVPQLRPSSLYYCRMQKHCNSYNLASSRKLLDFYWS